MHQNKPARQHVVNYLLRVEGLLALLEYTLKSGQNEAGILLSQAKIDPISAQLEMLDASFLKVPILQPCERL